MLRFKVEIMDALPDCTNRPLRTVRGLSLPRAWKLCHRAARRGVKLFGGRVTQGNWGVKGGQFPQAYRTAVIQADWR